MHKLWSSKVPARLLAGLILSGALILPFPLLAQGKANTGASGPSAPSASIKVADDQDGEVEEATETKDMEEHEGRASGEQREAHGRSEADEAIALASKAHVTLQQAQATALSANPGATIVRAGLEDENGSLVYAVLLSSGQDLKVDAGNGSILSTDQGGGSGEQEER